MRVVLPKALDAIGRAELDLESVDMVFVLVDDSHVFDAAVEFLDELDAVLGTGAVLGSRTMSGGLLSSDETTHTVSGVSSGVTIAGLYLVHDSGSPSSSRVLAFADQKGDTTALRLVTNGADVTIVFNSALMRI